MQMIFGTAGGPSGYIAKVDGGVLQTYSKNSLLMSAAMKSAKGGENLTSDKLMSQVAERLPKDRMFELFIGVRSILDAALPLAAMGGVNLDLDLPASMPPIGVGVAGAESGAQMSVYLPAPVIKVVMSVAAKAQGQMGGGDEEEPEDGAPKRPGGQPRF